MGWGRETLQQVIFTTRKSSPRICDLGLMYSLCVTYMENAYKKSFARIGENFLAISKLHMN